VAVSDFIYPTTIELRTIAQTLLPRLEQNRVVFSTGFFPIRSVDSHLLEWEQKDNYVGLQQARGLNGRPSMVRPIGGRRYQVEPGVYGEFEMIDERELTTRRQWGSFESPINISDLVLEAQNKLLQRRFDRIEKIVWDLLLNGTFSVPGPNGAILHVDSFSTQTFAASVPWATPATSTPLADLRAVQLKSRGYSVNFGSTAKLYMNRTTFNTMLINTNSADLYGRRTSGFGTINGPNQLNELLMTDDLPSIVIYDEGYLDEGGLFQLFIPNNKVVMIGARRDAEAVGEYRMTRNATNPGMSPGAYTKIVDDPNEIPRSVSVHDGHNGGPVLFYPSAIVVLTV
jgi:hypothetical protein